MDYKKAIDILQPMADNIVLPSVAEALETAIRAMGELPRVKEELSEWQHRFEKYADYSVQRDKMIEQLMEDLRGDCTSCAKTDDFQNCMGNGNYFNACEDCDQECRCKDCEEGSKWEWRGVVEPKVVDSDQVKEDGHEC